MSRELTPYPVDKIVGVIRPVFVTPNDFPDQDPFGRGTHFHHLGFEDGRDELQGRLGRTLRFSVGQRLPGPMHFITYPGSVHNILGQPKLPSDDTGKNRLAMLHVAKVVSRQAVQLIDGVHANRTLTDEEHAYISSPQITYVEAGHRKRPAYIRHKIGRAFTKHAIEEHLPQVATPKQIEAYLLAKSHKDKPRLVEMGNLLIRNALDESIASVQPYYDLAVHNGMVTPGRPDLRTTVHNFTPQHEFPEYYGRMIRIFRRMREEEPQYQQAPVLPLAVALQTGADELESKAA